MYFDDYPMFSLEKTAPETDALVSDFLDLLGWRHDRTGPKGKPFSPSFDVLGMTMDLAGLRQAGSVTLKNKEGRVEKIASKVVQVQQTGNLSLAEAQEIHGLLNFATGYFAGRSLKYCCFKISIERLVRGGSCLAEKYPARDDSPGYKHNDDTCVDRSWEGGVGGLGAVLLDESSGSRL